MVKQERFSRLLCFFATKTPCSGPGPTQCHYLQSQDILVCNIAKYRYHTLILLHIQGTQITRFPKYIPMQSKKIASLHTPPMTSVRAATSAARSRRRALDSSEESTSSTQSRIDTSSYFRTGAPSPLPALPLRTGDVDENSQTNQNFDKLKQKVHDALGSAGVNGYSLRLCTRYVN